MDGEPVLRVRNNRLRQIGDGDRNRDEEEVVPAVHTDYDNFCYAMAVLLALTAFYWLMMGLIMLSQKLFEILT